MFPYAYDLRPAGWLHLVYFGIMLPAMCIRARKQLGGANCPLPSRLRHFQTTAIELSLLLTFSILVAKVQWIWLFPRALPPWTAVIAGVAFYLAAVAFMRPRWRRAVQKPIAGRASFHAP